MQNGAALDLIDSGINLRMQHVRDPSLSDVAAKSVPKEMMGGWIWMSKWKWYLEKMYSLIGHSW